MKSTYTSVFAHDHAGSLTPSLWSKLPLVLVQIIIDQTSNIKTLESWCEATKKNRSLQRVAFAVRWRTVTIDDRDLVPAPGEDERQFRRIERRLYKRNLGRAWKPPGEMVHQLLETINDDPDHCPANCVQRLVFDFRLLRYWKEDIQGADLVVHDLMPSAKALTHTLTMLESSFTSLRRVCCYGDTPPAILNFVAKIDAAKFRALEIRSRGAYGRLYVNFDDGPPFQSHPLRRWPLPLNLLQELHQLRVLDIHRLSNRETAQLLSVFPKLTQLQHLTMACEADEHDDLYGECALKSILDNLFQSSHSEEIVKSSAPRCPEPLPPQLKSLSLIDTNHHSQSVLLPLTEPPRLGTALDSLNVDIAKFDWIPNLIDCFPEFSLRNLSIPGCSRDGHRSICGDIAHVNYAITKHLTTLRRIKIVRAWHTDRLWVDELNSYWQQTYAIQELVLGSRNPEWYQDFLSRWNEMIPQHTLAHFLYGFYWGGKIRSGRWGNEVKRIRIDHLGIFDLDVTVLSETFYSHLKILMLQPRLGSVDVDDDEFSSLEAIDEASCVKLAERIKIQAPVSLRIIVIDCHWYWISITEARDQNEAPLWTWKDAKNDQKQSRMMSLALDDDDRRFLEPSEVPFWHDRDMIEWHQNLPSRTHPHKPSIEMVNQWNYFTILPIPRR